MDERFTLKVSRNNRFLAREARPDKPAVAHGHQR